MSILINKENRVIVQGITGHQGLFHTEKMLSYGTNIVGGVSPGKGGEWVLGGKIPVFDTAKIACSVTEADTSVIFIPARYAVNAIYEAIEAGIKLIVCVTEGIPIQDMLLIHRLCQEKNITIIGPNSPGIISPGSAKVGIIPNDISQNGNVGIISRSGTLTYEVMLALTNKGIGISTCVGIGGDPIIGSNFIEIIKLFESDPYTEKIVLIGEIGGSDEELAAEYISQYVTKPVYAYIAGLTAPLNKKMGHAGAIIEGKLGSAAGKIKSLQTAGVIVASHPEELSDLIKN